MTLFPVEQQQLTSDDYYTAPWVFEAMGITFDLDVCSPPGGVPWIPAGRFYTMADDGLTAKWEGRVWMNPPFSKPSPWVNRFIAHRHGVALLPFAKSAWFSLVWEWADALVYPGIDLSKFIGGPVFMPCVLAAFGDECVEAIGKLGRTR